MDKDRQQRREVGLWIDHKEAIIVSLKGDAEETKRISSDRASAITPEGTRKFSSEDGRDRRHGNVLNEFYDEVVEAVRGSEAIQIFGPGEAKGELEKRLERAGLKEHVLAIEPADKMTDREIAAKVRERFGRRPGPPNNRNQDGE